MTDKRKFAEKVSNRDPAAHPTPTTHSSAAAGQT